MRGGGVEAAALGVADAGVGGEGGGLDPAGELDAFGGRHLLDIGEEEVLGGGSARHLAEGSLVRKPRERVLAADAGEVESSGDEAVERTGREVDEEVLATRWASPRPPRKTRRPMAREPDSVRVSTSPGGTCAANSSPS